MPLETSYGSRGSGSPAFSSSGPLEPEGQYWKLPKLKRAYVDYLSNKRQEMDEQIDSRRYYHGSQYTTDQITTLKKRKQPIMTFNRVGRKIDGVIGLVEKLRQDPKAFARTPQHEEGAELATAAVRYVLDEQEWKAKSPLIALDGAIDGYGGLELDLEQGDQGDPEVGLVGVDVQAFFYDPRSYKHDFSDARYMGCGRWLDDDIAQEMFPDADFAALGSDSELTSSSDRERRWFTTDGVVKRVRIVEIWYQHQHGWCWAVFTGSAILKEGKSPFKDEKGKDLCKYIMFSGNVDQDGDRYGFVRNMKSAQDGINAKQSKMQHLIASKRLFISSASGLDVEKVRLEMARVDGVVVSHGDIQNTVKTDDQTFDFTGMAKLLELNLAEIERFGPNPELLGQQSTSGSSGRAIQLLQQAGMAELGPFILSFRGWKLRAYRAILNAVQQHWKAERWIRVTDDEGLAQFVQINGLQIDPQTGQPTMVNAIGSLDVDIILDEAPDAVTLQLQSFEVLQSLGPQFILQNPDIVLDLAPLDSATKKKIRDKQEQAKQQAQPGQQIAMEQGKAEVEETQASAALKQAQAVKAMTDAKVKPLEAMMNGQGGEQQSPQMEQAEIEDKLASAFQKRAQGELALVNAHLRPAETIEEALQDRQELAIQDKNAEADRQQDAMNAQADRVEQRRAGDADREIAAKAANKPPARR